MMDRRLYSVCEHTWAPLAATECGPFLVRNGDAGGKRVSAATCIGAYSADDIIQTENAMQALGQDRLFMIQNGDDMLDGDLEQRGYRVIDPVDLLVSGCAGLVRRAPAPNDIYAVWPPLAAQCEIWETDGIGPARLRVMDRVAGPKTSIMIRHNDRPAGTAFVAINDGIAMLHGLIVEKWARKQGLANKIMGASAQWAQNLGADRLSVLVVKANIPAQALYASLGMQNVGSYHYRIK